MTKDRASDYHKKRENILNSAAELFSQHGFSRTTVAKIAESTGISKANVFHYYANKEDILFDMLNNHLEFVVSRLQQLDLESETLLKDSIYALLMSYKNANNHHLVLLNDLSVLSMAQKKTILIQENKIVDFFKTVILKTLPHMTAEDTNLSPIVMTLLGSLNWTFTWFKQMGKMTHEEYAQFVADLLLNGLSAPKIPANQTTTKTKPVKI